MTGYQAARGAARGERGSRIGASPHPNHSDETGVIPGPWIVCQAAFVVLGFYWCVTMFRRWRSDLGEFRTTTDSKDKVVIASLWAATVLILACLLNWSVSLVGALRRSLG